MNDDSAKIGSNRPVKPDRSTARLAFSLVVIMLAVLFILALVLLFLPPRAGIDKDKLVEYYKWAFSVLIGAFGAWIGAGAAYFFGRENLAESSRSTEAALRIQQDALRGPPRVEFIKDATFTAMNTEFMFRSGAKKADVLKGLKDHIDYWFVPVLDDAGNGTLEDIVHSRVFWEAGFEDSDHLGKILSEIDTVAAHKDLRKLHGPSFFIKVTPGDKASDVFDKMDKGGVVVGIVVDEKGKPVYCFTKIDLQNLLKAQK